MWNHNWPSQYTYPGRYEDTGVTDRVLEYVARTGKKDLKILDVGCSVGIAAKSMKNNLLNSGIDAEITGIDISDGIKKEAKRNLDRFILGDILKTQINLEYDVVICSKIVYFESAKRKASVLFKCSELLKQDGGLITDAHNYDFPTILAQIKEDIMDTKKVLLKLRFGPKASYLEMIRIIEFRFKQRVRLIVGKDESLEYPNKILNGWKKLNPNTKFSFMLDTVLARFSAYTKRNPDYKKHRKNIL